MQIVQVYTFLMTTRTRSYDFSTIYGDFYKTACHFRSDFGPVCEDVHFHTSLRPLKIIIKIWNKVDSFYKLSEVTDSVFDLRGFFYEFSKNRDSKG